MAKFYTVVVKFDDGVKPEKIGFNDKLFGGEIVGIAAYDVMRTMDIAEKALENSFDESCADALEIINGHIGNIA